jgi:signal transduction histidine kinase
LIDFTSHEIRTPVSAILQCSSLVKENLESLRLHLTETSASEMLSGRLSMASLLQNLQEDIDALDSEYIVVDMRDSKHSHSPDLSLLSLSRYLSMWPGSGTYRKRCIVALSHTARHAGLLLRRGGSQDRDTKGEWLPGQL